MKDKFALDLSKFKKISGDKDSTTLAHPSGHTIKIAHSGVSPKMRGQLASMKPLLHFDDGGSVQPSSNQSANQSAQNSMQSAFGPSTRDLSQEASSAPPDKKANGGAVQKYANGTTNATIPGDVPDPVDSRDTYNKKKQQENPPPDSATNVDTDKAKQFHMNQKAEGGRVDGDKERAIHVHVHLPQHNDIQQHANGTQNVAPKNPNEQQVHMDPSPTEAAQNKANQPSNAGQQITDSYNSAYAKGGKVQRYKDGSLDIQPASDDEAAPGESQSVDLPDAPVQAPPPANSMTPASDTQAQQIQGGQAIGADDNNPTAPDQAKADATVADPTLLGGYQQRVSGMQQQANAEGQIGQARASAIQKYLDAQQQTLDNFNVNFKDLMKERKNTIQDIEDGYIDPDKYWENHSKIASAIGIVLGSINFSQPGENAGLKMLNQQMERNMQAQAANLNSKHNLLRANLEQFGNIKDAAAFFSIQQADMLSHQLEMEGAKQSNPLAQAKFKQLAGELQQQVGPQFQNFVWGRSMMGAPTQGQPTMGQQQGGAQTGQPTATPGQQPAQTTQANPNQAVDTRKMMGLQITGMMPKEDVAEATKEASKLGEVRATRNDYNQSFNDLDTQALAGRLTPADRASAIWTLAGKIQHASANRFNLEDAKKQADAMFPEIGDNDKTRDDKLRHGNALFDTLESGTPTLDRYGLKIPPQPFSRIEVKRFGGVEYQRPKNNPNAKWKLK